MLRWFFDNFKFKKSLLLKLGQIFDEVAKLGWLILWALLKTGVAEGVASEVNDFTT